jgi:uncharacterized protein
MSQDRSKTVGPKGALAGLLGAAVLVLVPSVAPAEVDIPPVPEGGHYINDRAGLLSPDAADEIGEMQKRAAEQHKAQLVVVTIRSKGEYGGGGLSIEEFAGRWFDEWGLGIRRDGRLYNRGILLLISRDDRKARIELGEDWGHRWDAYCRRLMNDVMVPKFKEGEHSLGIVRGVDALVSMAERGPNAEPPEPSVVDKIVGDAKRWNSKLSILPGPVQIVLVVLGILLIVLSFYLEDETQTRWAFWGGVALIVIALLTWLVLAAVAMFGDTEHSGYAVGGFAGGSSGGGGATGSW